MTAGRYFVLVEKDAAMIPRILRRLRAVSENPE